MSLTTETFYELINLDNCRTILENFDDFVREEWTPLEQQKFKYQLESIIKICAKTKSNTLPTKYKFAKRKTEGRVYVAKIGLQQLPREFRNTIADDYCDLDVVNCYPTLLRNYCKKNSIEYKGLNNYVENRANLIAAHPEFKVKDVVRNTCNGGVADYNKVETKPVWLTDLKENIHIIHQEIKKQNKERYIQIQKHNSDCPIGALITEILERTESEILIESISFCRDKLEINVENIVPMFDGFMIPNFHLSDDSDFEDLQTHIKEKFEVTIIKKPMETIDLSDYTLMNKVPPTDYDSAVEFKRFMESEGHYFCRFGKLYYWFNRDIGIWNNEDISDIVPYINKCKTIGTEKKNYRCDTYLQQKLLFQFKKLIEIDDDLIEKEQSTTKGYLAFNNGIYDFKNKSLLPFHHKFYFTFKLKIDYNPNFDMKHSEKIYRKVICPGMFNKETGDYFIHVLARSLAGERDKNFFCVTGRQNSGKGVITELIKESCSCYQDEFSTKNLIGKKFGGSGDDAKDKGWIFNIRNRRVAIGNEFDNDGNNQQKVNGNLVKTIASGGDAIKARPLFVNECKFVPQCQFFVFCNDVPEISPPDAAVFSRLKYLRTENSYMSGNEYEKNKHKKGVLEADPHIKDFWVKQRHIYETFLYMVLEAYSTKLMDAPESVVEESNEWQEDENLEKQILGTFTTDKGGPGISFAQLVKRIQCDLKLSVSKRVISRTMIDNGYITKNIKQKKVYRDIKLTYDYDETAESEDELDSKL